MFYVCIHIITHMHNNNYVFIGCANGFFLSGATCMVCPTNSGSTNHVSTNCECSGNTVTSGGSSTTTTAECSSMNCTSTSNVDGPHTVMCVNSLSGCPADWRRSSVSPLVCERCPERSQRSFGGQLDNCTCFRGYEYGMGSNSDVCLGESSTIVPTSC